MSKIIADKSILDYCKSAKPGNKTVYVNMDAINELPDQFEVVLTEIKFDHKTDFSDVGNGNLMPTPALMYRIAEAVGISGGDNSITEPVTEEVDINPMLIKSLESEPTFRKMIVGRKVKKFSTLLQEDGTVRRSSPCTSIFNVWERCLELWSAEEANTNGYDSSVVKHYQDENAYYEYTWNKQTKKRSLKYETTFKRRAHFNAELKFAHAKAETKAHNKTIRELAGLMTGYTADELKEGKFIFSKVRKSREALKLEQAANLARISGGNEPSVAGNLLFGQVEDEAEIKGTVEETTEPDPFDDPEPVDVTPTPEEELLGIFMTYKVIIKDDTTMNAVVNWLEKKPDNTAANYQRGMDKAIGILKDVEKQLDLTQLVEHKFY